MDFGIAARVEQATAEGGDGERLMGTPSHMAPEYVLRQEIGERTDVLCRRPDLLRTADRPARDQGNDLFALLHRITSTDIRLPPDSQLDERITAILYRAIARDPESATRRWCSSARRSTITSTPRRKPVRPPPAGRGRSSSCCGACATRAISRRCRSRSAQSTRSRRRTARASASCRAPSSGDFALTNKILKLVNSAFYRQAGAATSALISRAVMVLGFDAVRNIAITVLLFEHLQNKGNANQLKDEFLRANFAGILAKDVGIRRAARCRAGLHLLDVLQPGRMLAQYYFPRRARTSAAWSSRRDQRRSCGPRGARHLVRGDGRRHRTALGFPAADR